MKQLEELLLMANQRAYQNFHNIFEISRIFNAYPKLANDAMQFLFTVDGKIPKPMLQGPAGCAEEDTQPSVSWLPMAGKRIEAYEHQEAGSGRATCPRQVQRGRRQSPHSRR